jgi:anaerobic selenocysteine-containing dehydrogenase
LRFFHKLGASQLYRRSMCGAVRSEAWAGTYGLVPGIGPEAAENAKLTIVWGNNATVANLHLVRNIRKSLRKGGKLVVIDTLRTKIAEQADLHLAPRPSTDVLLAFALAVELKRIGAHDRTFIDQHVPAMMPSWRGHTSGRWTRLLPNAASKPMMSARSRDGWPMPIRS